MTISKWATIAVMEGAILVANPNAGALQYDLVNNNSQTVPGLVGSALFESSGQQPTGSGVFNPFLRLHHHGNDPFEQAFNTSAPGNPPDGFNAINGVHTHDLLFSTLQIINRLGTDYFQFTLDLGEPGNASSSTALLLLQKFDLYTGNTAAPTFAGISGNPANLGTLRFDLAGNTIMFVDKFSGNGQADVNIFVPTAAFAGNTDTYLYLYAEMGNDNGGPGATDGDAEGTFEEFAALTSVPDGGSALVLLGVAITGLSLVRRKLC